LNFCNGESSFYATRLMARIHRSSRVVHVRIEQTGYNRASAQIDRPYAGGCWTRSLRETDDAAVSDRQPRSDHAASIHEFAVSEDQIRLRGVLWTGGNESAADNHDGSSQPTFQESTS
jgi:hypothetical protein